MLRTMQQKSNKGVPIYQESDKLNRMIKRPFRGIQMLMKASQDARQGISNALSEMVTNIHSVAGEFEAVDQQIAESVNG